ncbi:MAG TPA: hypothetical protein VNX02_17055 [Steroidobacteraceae bacterium]|jgi:hypothetical protein|nr:hypothetical protein [Steroidobacteraceae bacterium]
MDATKWIADYEKTSRNALTVEWFVSPLEYAWGNGKQIADSVFRGPSTQNATLDQRIAPELYKVAMKFDFRAKMMVYAFMRELIAKTYALEIESGLISLYGLDFMSCLSQWIYVVEGYCRKLFQVTSQTNVKSTSWVTPTTGDPKDDRTIDVVCRALGRYLDTIVYQSTNDAQTTKLNRHLMLHGNLQSEAFYSQKNCLSLMFVLDSLVFIEMVKNGHFPQIFQDGPGEADRIARRKLVYAHEMEHSMEDPNLMKIALLDEHV